MTEEVSPEGDTGKQVVPTPDLAEGLYDEVRMLIESARTQVATLVNQTLVLTYWRIGKTIKTEVLDAARGQYGASILKQLACRLTQEFGNGFSYSALTRMAKFYAAAPDHAIVATLSQQLSWSHFVELIKPDDDLKRQFYIHLCADGRWSVRTLRERMDSMLYERTAISKKPEALIRQELTNSQQMPSQTSPVLFLKDPYLLDFLDLKDNFSEKDLESAILLELERFILELGSDFAFMSRQKRIQIGGNDYYMDLLFYHRKLRRLVLIELKLGDFKPEYKGQVELYLKWLAKYERQPGEQSPIAIILCGGKDNDVIELMDLEAEHIHVSEYWLTLPPKEVLQAKLQKAMFEARTRFELRRVPGSEAQAKS
jgi:predicted nuclease of restriction endonuclease-like (RecB) superfamily